VTQTNGSAPSAASVNVSTPTVVPPTTTPPSGGALGATATATPQGEVLAATGAPIAGGILGGILLVLGGLGIRFRKR
jgi:hypothetical protein